MSALRKISTFVLFSWFSRIFLNTFKNTNENLWEPIFVDPKFWNEQVIIPLPACFSEQIRSVRLRFRFRISVRNWWSQETRCVNSCFKKKILPAVIKRWWICFCFQVVRLENHVIELFFERRRSGNSNRSSVRSRTSSDGFKDGSRNSLTPRNSFREGDTPRGSVKSKKCTTSHTARPEVEKSKVREIFLYYKRKRTFSEKWTNKTNMSLHSAYLRSNWATHCQVPFYLRHWEEIEVQKEANEGEKRWFPRWYHKAFWYVTVMRKTWHKIIYCFTKLNCTGEKSKMAFWFCFIFLGKSWALIFQLPGGFSCNCTAYKRKSVANKFVYDFKF